MAGDDIAIPTFRGRYPGEHLVALRRDPIGFLRCLAREEGDAARFWLGNIPVVLLSHPDHLREFLVDARENFVRDGRVRHSEYLIGNGLINSDGDFHLRQRRLMQPAFHRRRIEGYAAAMARHALDLDARWRALPPAERNRIDVGEAMSGVTLGIVAETLFGRDLRAETGAVSAALTVALERFGMVVIPFSSWLVRLPFAGMGRLRDAQRQLDAVVYALIAERRAETGKTAEGRDDLLSLLIAAREQSEGGDAAGGMTDRQVRDEAMTLLLAGHETSANALTWALYLLARHPEAAASMRAELDALLPSPESVPSFEDLSRLAATRRFLSEALRLYPPIWITARGAVRDHRLKNGGQRIPAGSLVISSQCVLHTDPRWWPGTDPFAFDPERFLPEREAGRPRYAFLPFGTGPHACIGEQFAWTESLLILATLVRRWDFAPTTPEPVAPAPLLTLRPSCPVLLSLTPRNRT